MSTARARTPSPAPEPEGPTVDRHARTRSERTARRVSSALAVVAVGVFVAALALEGPVRPGDRFGLGFGIAATALLTLAMLYAVRRRAVPAQVNLEHRACSRDNPRLALPLEVIGAETGADHQRHARPRSPKAVADRYEWLYGNVAYAGLGRGDRLGYRRGRDDETLGIRTFVGPGRAQLAVTAGHLTPPR
ncbi:MAG: hypothetical protein AAFX50_09425 [Acidobacteriota bacterium]